MKEANVDLYLCGEFHAVTVNEKADIWQIVHGSALGGIVIDTQDYLVIEVNGKTLNLKMKSFPMEADGDNMWNLNKNRHYGNCEYPGMGKRKRASDNRNPYYQQDKWNQAI